jgi:putative heme iron utilization protein
MLGNGNASTAPPARDPRQDSGFEPQAQSKQLLRVIRSGALATLTAEGGPFATLTAVATHYDGSPILLLSRLAVHTRNLERDPRCSLLLAQGGRGDPLAHPRLTLEAVAARTDDKTARERFLRRNPKSALYADFPDFSFWRLTIVGAHLNGGFARAADLGPENVLTPITGAEALLAAEEETLDDLNRDHQETLALLARGEGERAGAWRAVGLDPEGLDLACGDRTSRVAFAAPAPTPKEFRIRLTELAQSAKG